jgi:hypothetical protein
VSCGKSAIVKLEFYLQRSVVLDKHSTLSCFEILSFCRAKHIATRASPTGVVVQQGRKTNTLEWQNEISSTEVFNYEYCF